MMEAIITIIINVDEDIQQDIFGIIILLSLVLLLLLLLLLLFCFKFNWVKFHLFGNPSKNGP